MPTDAHCHVARRASRHFICTAPEAFAGLRAGVDDAVFCGYHPWECSLATTEALDSLRALVASSSQIGVGEIGMDRLRSRTISNEMRGAFAAQLEIAADFGRPVVLHGAKCWGEVLAACRPFAGRIPAFLFHGFSRSGGLIPDIARIGGFISAGPAVLNDHAVNYRELVASVPLEMLLVESDATPENEASVPDVDDIARKVAELRGMKYDELAAALEDNADRFLSKKQ